MMTSNLIVTRIGLIAEADVIVKVTPVITNPAKDSAKGPELSSSDAVYDPRVGNGGVIPGWTEVAVSPSSRVDCLLSSGWTTAAVIADCEPKEVRLVEAYMKQ